MARRAAQHRYRSDGTVMTPARAVVLLYERLLRDLDDASAALGAADRGAAHQALVHAQEIIDGLDVALDTDVWPEGVGLRDLYHYLGRRLVEANLRGDPAAVAECRRIIEPLATAWSDAWTATNGCADAPAR
jgi:flagellar protein FliS